MKGAVKGAVKASPVACSTRQSSGSMPTWLTLILTSRLWSRTAMKPPGWNSYSSPSIRLQQVRKWRAYSKMWKPIKSALSMPRMSSSRTGIVRKISDEGKGVWRKSPTRAVRSLRRMYDGSSSKW